MNDPVDSCLGTIAVFCFVVMGLIGLAYGIGVLVSIGADAFCEFNGRFC